MIFLANDTFGRLLWLSELVDNSQTIAEDQTIAKDQQKAICFLFVCFFKFQTGLLTDWAYYAGMWESQNWSDFHLKAMSALILFIKNPHSQQQVLNPGYVKLYLASIIPSNMKWKSQFSIRIFKLIATFGVGDLRVAVIANSDRPNVLPINIQQEPSASNFGTVRGDWALMGLSLVHWCWFLITITHT